MRLRAALVLLVLLLAARAAGAAGRGGGRRRKPPRPPCPHPHCRCRRASGGVQARCEAAGTLPLISPVGRNNITYTSVSLVLANLTDLPPGRLAGLRTHELHLGGNLFSAGLGAGALSGVGAELRVLSLSDCRLPGIPAAALIDLPHLHTLYLDGNNLTTIGAPLPALPALKTLYLYHSQLQAVTQTAFSQLPELHTLKLQDNSLSALPRRLLRPLKRLNNLDLSNNALTALPSGVFRGLSNLTWLELDGNQLTSLNRGVLKGLGRLKYMFLDGNPLSALPDGTFRSVRRLIYLSLEAARLPELSKDTFRGLARLKTLMLESMPSSHLPAKLFHNMRRLARLRISLELQGGLLAGLDVASFSRRTSLKKLKVYVNNLSECRCNVPWIRSLTRKGALVEGKCMPGSQTEMLGGVGCFARKAPKWKKFHRQTQDGWGTFGPSQTAPMQNLPSTPTLPRRRQPKHKPPPTGRV